MEEESSLSYVLSEVVVSILVLLLVEVSEYFLESDMEGFSFHLDTPRSTSSCLASPEGTLSLDSSLWRLGMDLESPEESTESLREEVTGLPCAS